MKCLKKTLFYIFPIIVLIASTSVFSELEPVLPPKAALQYATSNILNITEHKRLSAKIASEYMNRITIVNDRIVNVFGDEGTFVVQTDEHTGQIFIKPTADNGDKPLSITLITENGITQDLTLTPSPLKASTLILKPQTHATENYKGADALIPGFSSRNATQQEQQIQIMKQAVLGELAVVETRITPSRKIAGFNLHYVKSYQAGSYLVGVWLIKNNSKNFQELQEKTFFKNGDLALSLQKRLLSPNEKTYLYILGSN